MNDFLNSIVSYYNSSTALPNKPANAVKPQPISTTSNPSAVSPSNVTPSPSPTSSGNKSLSTPAAQKFISQMSTPTAANAPTQPNSIWTGVAGGPKPESSSTTTTTPTSSQVATPASPATSNSPVQSSAQVAYQKYLSDQTRLNTIQDANDKQKLDAMVNKNNILDNSGGLRRGVIADANLADRRAETESAYGSLAESAAARSAGVSQGAYNTEVGQNKPITLGNELYQPQPDGSYKIVAGTPPKLDTSTVEVNGNKELINNQTGAVVKNLGSATAASNPNAVYVPGANQTVDAWVASVINGNSTMSSVPAAYKNQVAVGINSQPATAYSPLAASRNTTAATKIASNFIKLPQYQLTANGLPYLQRIDAALKTPGSVSDQDLLDSLTKLNTAGNAISDAQVKIITDGKSLSDWGGTILNKLGNGGVLSNNQRQQIDKISKAIFANYQKGYQPVYDQVTKQLTAAGIPKAFWTIPDLNNLDAQIQGGSSSNNSQGGNVVTAPDGTKIVITD